MKYTFMYSLIFFGTLLISSCANNDKESFAYGNFESVEILVPSETTGLIRKMRVNEGDRVIEKDTIAIIDTIQLYLQKKQMMAAKKAVSARLDQINAQIGEQKINIENLEREYERFGTLFLEDAATKKQMDDLEGKLELAKARITSLNSQKLTVYAEIDAKEAQILGLNDQLNRSFVVSPDNGVILERFLKEGEMAMPGKPVVKIADLSELILRVFVAGDQLVSISLGDKVKVLYDGSKGINSLEGTITWISSEAEFTPKNIQTREERVNLVYAVKVRVPNKGALKIGMPGEIKLISQSQ